MESINNIERRLEPLFARLPQLPQATKVWLASNIWWITLVGAFLSVLGLINLVVAFFTVVRLVGSVTGFWGYSTVVALLYSLFSLLLIVFLFMAVSPLRRNSRRGWTILFRVAVLYFFAAALYFVLTILYFNIGTLLGALVSTGLGLYILYQIKPLFKLNEEAPVVKPALKKRTVTPKKA